MAARIGASCLGASAPPSACPVAGITHLRSPLRLIRTGITVASKTDVRIIDFVDTGHPALLRMWDKRRRGYRSMGYRIEAEAAPYESLR